MADFKTTLERLARGEIDFNAVAGNIDKLLAKRPQAVVAIMDQLKQAVVDGVIDAETYAMLKSRITVRVQAMLVGDAATRLETAYRHAVAATLSPSRVRIRSSRRAAGLCRHCCKRAAPSFRGQAAPGPGRRRCSAHRPARSGS